MNDLEKIKGIGYKTKEQLNKLGIFSVEDLIYYYPFRYELLKRSNILTLEEDEKIIIDGKIESKPVVFRFKRNMNKMSFRMLIEGMIIQVVIFNRAFLVSHLVIGKEITVIGKWDKNKNIITASDIILEPLGNEIKIEPIYRTTSGLNKKVLKKYIANALLFLKLNNNDYVPAYLKEKYNFLEKNRAVEISHIPQNEKLLKRALLRLKYEELFIFMIKILYLKKKTIAIDSVYSKKIARDKLTYFIKQLPFELTKDQKQAMEDIIKDIKAPQRMNRLLQGDVGSGKTIVAIIAILIVYLNNFQSAFMVPTEILAKQHFENIKKIFKDINIKIELLVGSLSKKEKESIAKRLQEGKIDLIIGTHALIQEGVNYYNLGLVITDEQHRFGVNQRASLRNKSNMPDVLYMSATPIPRTYALTIYGDMDISTIKSLPKGRKEIITYLKTSKEINDVLLMIKKELDLNHQVYVVAPLIEESEKIDLENVNKLKHQFDLAFGKKYNIGMIHGKLADEIKDKEMNLFIKNKTNILISTTVIEVGVDVKNATMMVIFDAERFGLSTIHQLRGRVGRSELQSYCILISDKERERLKIMTETNDGFLISETDFKLRGHGDLFGIKQSGDMNFKIADLKKDYKILLQAKEDAEYFIKNEDIKQYPLIYRELKQILELD